MFIFCQKLKVKRLFIRDRLQVKEKREQTEGENFVRIK